MAKFQNLSNEELRQMLKDPSTTDDDKREIYKLLSERGGRAEATQRAMEAIGPGGHLKLPPSSEEE